MNVNNDTVEHDVDHADVHAEAGAPNRRRSKRLSGEAPSPPPSPVRQRSKRRRVSNSPVGGNVDSVKVDNSKTTRTNAIRNYQYSSPPDDIDDRDANDPQCISTIVCELYDHFRAMEQYTSVRNTYMTNQIYINERMRAILVDWLVEVHLKFKLVPETLYLTINLVDRYLAEAVVTRAKLQLVGVTALLIATKYEELYPVELEDLVYICDRAYSRDEVS